MASSASVSPAAAAVSGAHLCLLLSCSPRRLPRPRPRPRSRLRLAACHVDTLLSSGAHTLPAHAACLSASSAGGFSDWLRANGLPPGKVAILERPVPCSRGGKDRPLHYVAASQDLQVLCEQGSWLIPVVKMRSGC